MLPGSTPLAGAARHSPAESVAGTVLEPCPRLRFGQDKSPTIPYCSLSSFPCAREVPPRPPPTPKVHPMAACSRRTAKPVCAHVRDSLMVAQFLQATAQEAEGSEPEPKSRSPPSPRRLSLDRHQDVAVVPTLRCGRGLSSCLCSALHYKTNELFNNCRYFSVFSNSEYSERLNYHCFSTHTRVSAQ